MPANKFYLDDQRTQEVIVSWRGMWKDITVTHNGKVIGGFQNLTHLKQGAVFHLTDGSTLVIHFSTERYAQGLRVDYNGRPVQGSGGDPVSRLKNIFGIAAFFGGLSFVLGGLVEFGDVRFLKDIGVDWTSMVAGAIIASLGYCTWKFSSGAALMALCILIGADAMITLFYSLDVGSISGIHGMVLKVFLIIAFVKGFAAIREIKDSEATG